MRPRGTIDRPYVRMYIYTTRNKKAWNSATAAVLCVYESEVASL